MQDDSTTDFIQSYCLVENSILVATLTNCIAMVSIEADPVRICSSLFSRVLFVRECEVSGSSRSILEIISLCLCIEGHLSHVVQLPFLRTTNDIELGNLRHRNVCYGNLSHHDRRDSRDDEATISNSCSLLVVDSKLIAFFYSLNVNISLDPIRICCGSIFNDDIIGSQCTSATQTSCILNLTSLNHDNLTFRNGSLILSEWLYDLHLCRLLGATINSLFAFEDNFVSICLTIFECEVSSLITFTMFAIVEDDELRLLCSCNRYRVNTVNSLKPDARPFA